MKSRIRHGLDFVPSQSPKSMTLAFSCLESEGPRSTFGCDWKRHCSFLLRRSKGMSICHLHCTYVGKHTHTHAHLHMLLSTYSNRGRREKAAVLLPSCLGGCPKNVCYTLCRDSTLSVFISLSISVSVSVIPPLFRVLGFYGICVTHPSTLECVNSGTFYGILMLNMTAILFLFYLPTRACLCVCLIAYRPPPPATTLSYFLLMLPPFPLPSISGNYALFRE